MSSASRKYPRQVLSKKIEKKVFNANLDLYNQDPWRIFRIMSEFVDGFELMAHLGPAVTIFGSARTKRGSALYQQVEEIGRELAKSGFAVMTGGGPGSMEAANKGAFEAGGRSVGLNIELPLEQNINPFINLPIGFRYFFIRKVMFIKYAQAVIITPGGLGTMDECFEVMTLIQTDKIKPVPLILVGKEYWQGMLDWMNKKMAGSGMINPEELSFLKLVDDPKQIIRIIKKKKVTSDQGNF